MGLDTVPVPTVPGIGSGPGLATGFSIRRPDRPSAAFDPLHPEVPIEPGDTLEIVVQPPSKHDPAGPSATSDLSSTLYRRDGTPPCQRQHQ